MSAVVPDSTLVGGLLFALAGSAHCAGMCGVFALQAAGTRRRPLRSALYLLGKTSTYVFLGAVAGALGNEVVTGGVLWQAGLGITVAVVLLLAGWKAIRPDRAAPSRMGAAFSRVITPVVGAIRDAEKVGGPLALGAATGLLPCGLVYAAAAAAAETGTPLGGAVFMAVFGLGTAPVLLAVGLAGRGALTLAGAARVRMTGGILILAMGAFTLVRAVMPLLRESGAQASCH